jgi:hypothetical protein
MKLGRPGLIDLAYARIIDDETAPLDIRLQALNNHTSARPKFLIKHTKDTFPYEIRLAAIKRLETALTD